MNKIMPLNEAVDRVESGITLALGGMTLYRRPIAFIRGLVEKFKQTGTPNRLTLLTFTASLESDLLLGAGMVSKVRTCYFGLEIFGLAPMFTYLANHGEIEIIEETETSIALGLRAQMAGIGFMPGRAWIGTGLPDLRPDVQRVLDPYTGEELMAFPAIRPDVTVLHALVADEDGNAVIGTNRAIDNELALTAKIVLITTEKLVQKLDKADIIGPLVSGVVHCPRGAQPTSCHPEYPMDGQAIMEYTEQVSDPATFDIYLKKWLADFEQGSHPL